MTHVIPTSSVALLITERRQKKPLTLGRVPIPPLAPLELLLNNAVAAQAFADPHCVDYDVLIPAIPHVNGWDVAGTVIAVGDAVTRVKVGERVLAVSGATSVNHGGYQQHPICAEFAAAKIPESLSFEEAATIGLAYATATAGLFSIGVQVKEHQTPSDSEQTILVWGGASSVGAMAIQIAKACRFKVVATASPANFDYVRSLGADHVLDYNDPGVVDEVRKITDDKLRLAYDAVSKPESLAHVFKCIGAEGGKVGIVSPRVDTSDAGGRADLTVHYLGGEDVRSEPELRDSFAKLEKLLADGQIKPHPHEVRPGGLGGVDAGWQLQREGKVRGKKLVYRIKDTPGLADV